MTIPGSKSITNRALILASLASGPSTITGALRSRDTNLMIDGLRALGTTIEAVDESGTTLAVTPGPLHGAQVSCGLAGTVMRFLPPVATFADGPVSFDGDPQARLRPMGAILDGLRQLGVSVTGDALPFTVHAGGDAAGGEVVIDASGSSQFVSGLLLSAARFTDGVTVRHRGGSVPSMPHIEMTIDMLTEAGVQVSVPEPGVWRVERGPIAPVNWVIEPDLSNATPFLAAAAVTAGTVTVPLWPTQTTQAGDHIREILARMGCAVELSEIGLTVSGPDTLDGIEFDLHDVGELTPTVAAVAAFAGSPTVLSGIAHLRGHETDRLAALTAEITALGGNCEETADGLRITPAPLRAGLWHSYADHRMATAGAILGLRVPGVEVEDIETTSKTLPDFAGMWASMLGQP